MSIYTSMNTYILAVTTLDWLVAVSTPTNVSNLIPTNSLTTPHLTHNNLIPTNSVNTPHLTHSHLIQLLKRWSKTGSFYATEEEVCWLFFWSAFSNSNLSWLCAMTHSCVMWLIHVWRDSFMCEVTHACVTWLIHVCGGLWACCVWRDLFICDVIFHAWRDSFVHI